MREFRTSRRVKKEKLSSGVPPALGFLPTPSGKVAQTEFVTNSTSSRGGAVNRLFTFILKTCPASRKTDPYLAGLLKFFL